jgi:threonine/homoserine/homoserine lactone efflux protein
MNLITLAMIFAAGFVIMTPIGPVSTICIRRSLIYGRRAGIIAGAGDAAAIATYATIGVTGSTLLPHFFAPFATLWHLGISFVLVAVAILIWRTRPTLPKAASQTRASLAGGFGATLAIALANPADIVLFAALFAGLGIAIHTPLEHVIFCVTIFAGGCAYWIAMACLLDRWRAGLTIARMMWLNRSCSAFMLIGAAASLVSLARSA